MKVIHASIVLNEEEFIRKSIAQHLHLCDHWIFVEGADERYPKEHVNENGLSKDRTFLELSAFPDTDQKTSPSFATGTWKRSSRSPEARTVF